MSKKILIIGGVAGGATAAARLRRLDETSEIVMFERGSYISYANCGLPYHIGNVSKETELHAGQHRTEQYFASTIGNVSKETAAAYIRDQG